MQYYLLKRKYTNVYYTIRTNDNKPAVLAFTAYNKAKCMQSVIMKIDHHPQPIVIEKTGEHFIYHAFIASILPVIVFDDNGISSEMMTDISTFNKDETVFYLESKYKY